MPASAQPAIRFKTALKLAVQRCRNVAAKKEAMNKVERRNIASLLEKHKEETARIRVETIINEEIQVELLEVVELYCELCIARFGLIEQSREVDEGIRDAVAGILYASPKTDLKELHNLTSLFLQHYGREFVLGCVENQDNVVPTRITDKLIVQTPSKELVDLYLYEIAKAYSINWKPDTVDEPEREAVTQSPEIQELPLKDREVASSLPTPPPIDPVQAATTVPIHTTLSHPTPTPQTTAQSTKQAEDAAYDALQKRFEALKKR